MNQIEWTAFTWQAFATLVTGALAVGAATVVAIRQLTIARRQVDIQERQVWLAELTLREKLFERRLSTYNTIRRFLVDTAAGQKAPPSVEWHEFAEGIQASRFLFDAKVYEKLIVIYEETTDLWVALGAIKADASRPWLAGGRHG
jgi:hypothetical protein